MENTNWIPHINEQRCTLCGECIAVCPTRALGIVDNKVVVIDPDACNYCGECESICPVNAIDLPYQIVLESES